MQESPLMIKPKELLCKLFKYVMKLKTEEAKVSVYAEQNMVIPSGYFVKKAEKMYSVIK